MRIVAFERNGEPGVGVLADDGVSVNPYDLSPADAAGGVQVLADLAALGRPAPPTGDPVAIDGLHLRAPMPRPKRKRQSSPKSRSCVSSCRNNM